MRRKKDDKRVLRSGNGQNNTSRRRGGKSRRLIPKRNSNPRNRNVPRAPKKKKKRDKRVVFLMILALVAFVIGAAIGITMSFDDGQDDGPHYVNVTKEMTTNLNNTTQVYFDPDVDDVDYNENETSKLNVHYTYSDYTYKDYQ